MCIAPTHSILLLQGWEEDAGDVWSSWDLSRA